MACKCTNDPATCCQSPGYKPLEPSKLPYTIGVATPRRLTEEDIRRIIREELKK